MKFFVNNSQKQHIVIVDTVHFVLYDLQFKI